MHVRGRFFPRAFLLVLLQAFLPLCVPPAVTAGGAAYRSTVVFGDLHQPVGIAADGSGNVYVADAGNNRVRKFDAEGAYLLEWAIEDHDKSAGLFGIAADDAGNVYVTIASGQKV